MRRLLPALLPVSTLALAMHVPAGPAQAQDYLSFHSPSGNIHCAIITGDWAEARCDIFELTPSYRKRPADCDMEWGNSFAVGAQGGGYLPCVGDTVADPGGFVLDYGREVSLGAFTCTSLSTGMTCTNGMGHGFSVSKRGQEVF